MPSSFRRGAVLATLALAALAAAPAAASSAAPPQPAGFYVASDKATSALRLNGRPGTTLTSRVNVYNTTARDKVVRLQAADLETASAGGLSYDTIGLRREGTWMHLRSGRVRVPARGSTPVSFSVRVPAGVRGGSHYAGIVATDADPAPAPSKTSSAKDRRTFEVRRVLRMAVPVTVALPGPRRRSVDYTGASLSTDGGRPALSLNFKNSGTVLIQGATVDVRVERNGKQVVKSNSATAQLMPDSGVEYRVPWTGRAAAGDYRLVGVITPQGAKPVSIDEVVTVSDKEADRATRQLKPPVAAAPKASTPVAVWLALAGAALLVAGMGTAMWRMRKRMNTAG
jgi:hypothetical protein